MLQKPTKEEAFTQACGVPENIETQDIIVTYIYASVHKRVRI
jgi:hypothetical protein